MAINIVPLRMIYRLINVQLYEVVPVAVSVSNYPATRSYLITTLLKFVTLPLQKNLKGERSCNRIPFCIIFIAIQNNQGTTDIMQIKYSLKILRYHVILDVTVFP